MNTAMLVVGAFILFGIASLSYREWQHYGREREDVARLRGVLEAGDGLLTSLIDAEAGQRGFLLTGEERCLEPYDRAIRTLPAKQAILNGLQSGQVPPDSSARLNSLVDQKLAEMRRTIDLRRTQGAAPALALVLSDDGKQVMDDIRDVWSDIRAGQYSRLMAAQNEAESSARTAFLTTIVGSLVLLGFFVAGNRGINSTSRAREQAFADAQRNRDSLRTTLGSIGDAVISTDPAGRIVFANKVAQSLLRAPEAEIVGKHLDGVFRIVNEFTRASVESPVAKALREGSVVGLANHTILITQDGTEIPIDDSAAPIRSDGGPIEGTVLVFRDVAERRRAEATRQLLASIVVSSDDAIVSKDLNGTVMSWNRGAERMFGYSEQEVIGRSISVLYPPDRLHEMPEILGRIGRGERVEHHQTLRRTKNGGVLNVSVTVSPVHDASGRIMGASKIVRDITSQVRAQEEIAAQRERLRVTLSSIGDAVVATDHEGRVTYLNPVAEQLTGWPAAEAEGQRLEEVFRIVNEESRQTVENPVTKVLREGGVVGLANHTVLLARDGREIAIDDSAAPIRNDRGEMLGVVLVFRDITARRATEKQLAAQARELRQRARLMEGVHYFVRDLEDRIVYWNPGAATLYGFSAEEALGQVSHALLKTILPAPLEKIREQLAREGQWNGELVQTRRDGAQVIVASQWALDRDPNGLAVAILAVNVDVTARRRAEEQVRVMAEELRTSNAALRRANEDLQQFAFAASHDLQEPLRMITTYSQLLVDGYSGGYPGELNGEPAQCVKFISRGTARMRELLSDLLAYTQLTDQDRREVKWVELNEVTQKALDNLSPAIAESGAAVHIDRLPGVYGQEAHFVQLFQNLIGNAIKYRGENTPSIHVASVKDGSSWRVSVADNGIGIAPEHHDRVFGVFKRLHGSNIPGTGIGLAICQRIVERYGGKIWVESAVGNGATFHFTVPVVEEGNA